MLYHWFFGSVVLLLVLVPGAALALCVFRKKQRQKELEQRQRRKGYEGEMDTYFCLRKIRGYKKILHQVYIPNINGIASEIDFVVIHERGILVVENKNYGGCIYGKEEDFYWTQVLEKGRRRKFYNPVRQNQSHIRHLKRLMSDYESLQIPYVSVITFNDRSFLRKIKVSKATAVVTSSGKVRKRLRKPLRRLSKALTKKQVNEVFYYLQKETGSSARDRRKHTKQVDRLVKAAARGYHL